MFTNKKILELEKQNEALKSEVKSLNNTILDFNLEIHKINQNIDNKIVQHTNEIEARLLNFHKEITDKYFFTLERILKVHSETSLITALAHQVNQKDLTNLRSTLLKPFLEEKWKQEEFDKGIKIDNNIKSLGQELVQMRKLLHEEMLKKEREEKDTSELKGKLEIIDLIIGGKQ